MIPARASKKDSEGMLVGAPNESVLERHNLKWEYRVGGANEQAYCTEACRDTHQFFREERQSRELEGEGSQIAAVRFPSIGR